jgi:hypothetical protein
MMKCFGAALGSHLAATKTALTAVESWHIHPLPFKPGGLSVAGAKERFDAGLTRLIVALGCDAMSSSGRNVGTYSQQMAMASVLKLTGKPRPLRSIPDSL